MAKGQKGKYASYRNVHVDCDPLVYKIGFRCEKALYKVDGADFKTLTDALEYCAGMGVDKEGIIKEVVPEPWTEVVKELQKTLRKYRNLFNPGRMYLYLSPSDYFRYHICDQYKGNRTSSHKPYHYQKIRDWFVKKGAKIIPMMEADDIVAINHFHHWRKGGRRKQRVSLIIGEDKDFDNVPGWHYNPAKDKLQYIGSNTAICNFYRQLISGDAADNVKGVPRKGLKAAETLIPDQGCKEKEYWEIVRNCYLEYAEKNEIPKEEIIDELLKNAHLLWIMWEKEVYFEPPHEEDKCQNLKWLEKIQQIFAQENQ